jgi:hypothetical protein
MVQAGMASLLIIEHLKGIKQAPFGRSAIINLSLAVVKTSPFLRRSRSIVMLSEAKHPYGLGFPRGTGCFGVAQHRLSA